ncbi:MAG: hypothetical protein ACD_58C00010G0002 [uncultured bacterium]|nr:MAG: hypothetical protein ACD_58C00010G0002 [uncultured bacterium]
MGCFIKYGLILLIYFDIVLINPTIITIKWKFMRELDEIIKQAQKILSCPICHRKYQIPEIKLKGFWGNIFFLGVNCQNGHELTNMNVVISQNSTKSKMHNQFNNNDIKELAKVLSDFNGDFENIWKK